jgi:hypothetical protein
MNIFNYFRIDNLLHVIRDSFEGEESKITTVFDSGSSVHIVSCTKMESSWGPGWAEPVAEQKEHQLEQINLKLSV